MVDMQTLYKAVDQLPPDDLEALHRYIERRRRATWWVVPPDQIAALETVLRPVHEEAAAMSDEEIDDVIDEAIAEVRHARHDIVIHR